MTTSPDQDQKKSNIHLVDFAGDDINHTVEDCLNKSIGRHRERGLQDVIVVGYMDDGTLYVSSSHMTRADANFLLDRAKFHAIYGEDDDEIEY